MASHSQTGESEKRQTERNVIAHAMSHRRYHSLRGKLLGARVYTHTGRAGLAGFDPEMELTSKSQLLLKGKIITLLDRTQGGNSIDSGRFSGRFLGHFWGRFLSRFL